MRSLSTIIVAIVLSVIAAYATVKMTAPGITVSSPKQAKKTESAYDRIMRTGVIRCGYFIWPPFTEKDPNTGELKGFYTNMMKDIINLVGLKSEWVEVQIGMQAQDMASGKIDAVCGDGPWQASLVKSITFANAITYTPIYVYKNAADTTINTLSDLNDPKVRFAAMDGDVSLELAQRRFPKAQLVTISSTADPSQLLVSVASGKADVVLTDPVMSSLYMKSNPDKIVRLSDKPLTLFKGTFSVAKDEPKLLDMLNGMVDLAIDTGLVDDDLDQFDPDQKILFRARHSYGHAP